MVDPQPSGSVVYTWDTTGCYVNNNGQRNCFPNGQSTQTVTENSLLARDAGTITCSVSIDNGPMITSDSFTLRISGTYIHCSVSTVTVLGCQSRCHNAQTCPEETNIIMVDY